MTEQRINNVGYIIKRKQMIVDQKQAETCSHGSNKLLLQHIRLANTCCRLIPTGSMNTPLAGQNINLSILLAKIIY